MNIQTAELMGADYDWIKPVSEGLSNVVGGIFGPKRADQPQPPQINITTVPPPTSAPIPWIPIAIAGGAVLLLTGGAVAFKRRRR